MEVVVQPPSGGWHLVLVNGKVVAMAHSEKLATNIAADIQTREMLGRNTGV